MYYFFTVFFLLIGIFNSNAQYFNPICRYTSYGISLKGSYFDGDIKSSLQLVRPGIGASVNRRVTPRVTIFSELMWLRVKGDDNTGSSVRNPAQISPYIRNLNFRNDIIELSAGMKFDLFPSNDHYRKRPVYNVYGSLAIAFLYHNPKAKIFTDSTNTKTKWVALHPLQTENVNYSKYQLAIPIAIGIRYKLSLQWDLEVELAYHYTFTDYIDDVSGDYVDPSKLKNQKAAQLSNRSAENTSVISGNARDLDYIQNQLEKPIVNSGGYSYVTGNGPGSSRGSKRGNDGIVVLSFRLLYAFPGKVNCPKFRELQ